MDLTAKKKAASQILSILSSIPDEEFAGRIRKSVELSLRKASEPVSEKRGRSVFVDNEKNYHIEAMRKSGKTFRQIGAAFGISGSRAKGICDKFALVESASLPYYAKFKPIARATRKKLFGFETYS